VLFSALSARSSVLSPRPSAPSFVTSAHGAQAFCSAVSQLYGIAEGSPSPAMQRVAAAPPAASEETKNRLLMVVSSLGLAIAAILPQSRRNFRFS